MLSKIEPPDLNPNEPWKGDLFKRSLFANSLCELIRSSSHSSVIGIGAGYGFGKTFFLRRLREQIKADGGWVIYVNAWEYDYLESPLLALLDALKLAAAEQVEKKDIKKAFTNVAKAAAPALMKAAVKKAVEVSLGAESSKDIGEALAEASGKAVESLTNRIVKSDTTHQTLELLRGEIRQFVDKHLAEESKYKTLIVIVDELDRARPSFSIRFLETIKHVFSVSQVTFLVGCDRSVLMSSAKHEFGSDLPIDGYMRRLFDYWIDLPPPSAPHYVRECARRLNLVADHVLPDDRNANESLGSYATLLLLGHERDASLRFVEQSVAHAGVVLRLAASDRQPALIGWLQGLRQFAPALYEQYVCNGPVSKTYEKLLEYQPFTAANSFVQARILIWAANAKEPFWPTMERLLGKPNELFSTIGKIAGQHYHLDFDDRESYAFRIDQRMRGLSLHIG
jgi:KAP family P-loop domain